jgi:hypothetical protein
MAMFSSGDANSVLAAVLQLTNYPTVTSTVMRLGTNVGNATTVMTQITGSSYPTNGTAITFSTPTGQSSSNSGAISLANSSGSSWLIQGLEIWDTAGTPVRHLFGAWTGGTITVISGNVFAVPAAGVSASLV